MSIAFLFTTFTNSYLVEILLIQNKTQNNQSIYRVFEEEARITCSFGTLALVFDCLWSPLKEHQTSQLSWHVKEVEDLHEIGQDHHWIFIYQIKEFMIWSYYLHTRIYVLKKTKTFLLLLVPVWPCYIYKKYKRNLLIIRISTILHNHLIYQFMQKTHFWGYLCSSYFFLFIMSKSYVAYLKYTAMLWLTDLKNPVEFINFWFPWPQRFHSQEFSKYTTHAPHVNRGWVLLE